MQVYLNVTNTMHVMDQLDYVFCFATEGFIFACRFLLSGSRFI